MWLCAQKVGRTIVLAGALAVLASAWLIMLSMWMQARVKRELDHLTFDNPRPRANWTVNHRLPQLTGQTIQGDGVR